MGNRFDKEAKEVAEGRSPKKGNHRRKSGKVLREINDTNTDSGEVSRSAGGSGISRKDISLGEDIEEQIRKLRSLKREEGQGGDGGRRR